MPAPLRLTSWRYAVEFTSPGRGGLLPGQVRGLRHQLVGLDQRDVGEAAEVGLEAPDPLLRVEHRVVVAVGALQLDREAVRDHLVAGLPGVHARAGLEHHAGQVGADHVVGQVVPLGQRRELAVALEEAERRHRLEDRGPDGVVVDRAGHHRDVRLAGAELRERHVLDVQRLAGVLVAGSRGPRTCPPRPCAPSPRGRTPAGRGAAKSSGAVSPARMASRICFTSAPGIGGVASSRDYRWVTGVSTACDLSCSPIAPAPTTA